MSAISIHRWNARYRAEQPQPPERVAAWNAALARLECASLDTLAREDEWICVRRLPVALRIREQDGDVQAAHAWGETFAERLAQELRDGAPGNVVRYRDRRDALADLAYRAAVGDARRAWAWRQMGLIASDRDGSRATMIALAVLALLERPEWILPTLARLVAAERECGAWTAFAGALDGEQWHAVLAASPHTRTLERVAIVAAADGARAQEAGSVLAKALLAWAATHAHLAQRIERILAVLIAAEQVPAASAAASARRMAEALAQVRVASGASSSTPAPRASQRAPQSQSESSGAERARFDRRDDRAQHGLGGGERIEAIEPAHAAPDEPEAPALPDAVETLPTEWGGVMFLINVLPRAGLVDAAGERLRSMLRHLAIAHVGIPPDDPAVRAFCGGLLPPVGEELDSSGEETVARAAVALRALLEDRLDLEPGVDPVAYVCRRRGALRFEPGWIELGMEAATADVRLRRAALDLDPGFVPWLGCVVRFRYE